MNTNNKYLLLRHGENVYLTDFNGIIYPESADSTLGLTEKGRKEIKDLIPRLKEIGIDLIISSDFQRAKETAGIVAEGLGLKIETDERLRDINLGIYKGGPKQKLYDAFPDIRERWVRAPEKGETWIDCENRVLRVIKELDEKHQSKKILIVSHGDPLWLLEGKLKGLSNEELIKQKLNGETIKAGELRIIK